MFSSQITLYNSLHIYLQSIFELTIEKISYSDLLSITTSNNGNSDQLGKVLEVASLNMNM